MNLKEQLATDFITTLEKHDKLVGIVIVGDAKGGKFQCAAGGTAKQTGYLLASAISNLEAYYAQFSSEEAFAFTNAFMHGLAEKFTNEKEQQNQRMGKH